MAAKFVKKQPTGNGNGIVTASVPDNKFEKSYPALFEFLSLTKWDDGATRVPGTLLAFREEGRWKACLNDREHARSAFTSAETWEELMAALEEGLAEGCHEWRAKRDTTMQTQRKKI